MDLPLYQFAKEFNCNLAHTDRTTVVNSARLVLVLALSREGRCCSIGHGKFRMHFLFRGWRPRSKITGMEWGFESRGSRWTKRMREYRTPNMSL